jgi:hypothetical protein
LAFAYATQDTATFDHTSGKLGSPDKDALAWYQSEFAQKGLFVTTPGIDMLRNLFTLMIGLGPRESSGRYFTGRDLSAGESSGQSDTCEAGLFQTSWNIRSSSSGIPPLLSEFWDNPNGFLPQFKEGLSPTADDLNSYGSGDGIKYQWLSRFCPLFHVMVSAVGLRVLRQHWGPINRKEVSIQKSASDLLKSVEELLESVT